MSDFTQLKVAQIKDAVLKKDPNFIDRDVVGKSAWVQTAQNMGLTADDILNFVETNVVDDAQPVTFIFQQSLEEAELDEVETGNIEMEKDTSDNAIPKYSEIGWHDYVMSQFHESELDRGYPKVEGMRRVAEVLLGEIVFSGAVNYNSSMPAEGGDPGRSVVNYEIVILWKNGVEPYVATSEFKDYTPRTFRGLASCYPGNVKGNVFVVFPESIAETRAEARALRKALGLKVVAAEEFGDVEVNDSVSKNQDQIQEQQIFWITTKVKENNLNLVDVLNEFGVEKLEDASRTTGADIIKRVNELMKDNN